MYQAALRENLRQLHEHTERLQRHQVTKDGAFDAAQHRKILARLGVLLQRMSGELSQECERLGAWGVLGQGTGGQLINPTTGQPMDKQDLIGQSGHYCVRNIM